MEKPSKKNSSIKDRVRIRRAGDTLRFTMIYKRKMGPKSIMVIRVPRLKPYMKAPIHKNQCFLEDVEARHVRRMKIRSTIKKAFMVYTSVMTAYDQNALDKANSNPILAETTYLLISHNFPCLPVSPSS